MNKYLKLTIILSLTLLTYITLSTHFLAKKILTSPKLFSFPIHSSLYCAVFPLIILTEFPLYLVSSKQQMSTDLCFTLLNYLLEFQHFPWKLENLQTYFLHPTLVLLCITSSLWKVPLPFMQFSFSILFVILQIQSWQNLWPDAIPDGSQYDDGAQYFY